MKQIHIEIIVESEKFDDTYLDRLRMDGVNGQFFQEFTQAFSYAFHIKGNEGFALRRMCIDYLPDSELETRPPLWVKDENVLPENSPQIIDAESKIIDIN
jgi:hypothetical protein